MRSACLAVLLSMGFLLVGCASPGATSKPSVTQASTQASTAPADDAQADAEKKLIYDAVVLTNAGRSQDVLDGPVNALIAKYEAAYPGAAGVTVFCAKTMADTLLYLAEAARNLPVNKPGAKQDVHVLNFTWAQAYWVRGYAYGELKRYDLEEAELSKALKLSPRDSQYLNELAFVYQRKGQWQRSLDTYKLAEGYASITSATVPETTCVSFRGEGYVLVEMSRLDDAEAAYKSCLKLMPGETRSLGELGYIRDLRAKLR